MSSLESNDSGSHSPIRVHANGPAVCPSLSTKYMLAPRFTV